MFMSVQAESDSYDSETGGPPGLLPAGHVDDSELSEVSMVGRQSGDGAKCLVVFFKCVKLEPGPDSQWKYTVTIVSMCSSYQS